MPIRFKDDNSDIISTSRSINSEPINSEPISSEPINDDHKSIPKIRFNSGTPKPNKTPGMFSKQGVKDIGAGIIEGIDTAASLAAGAALFVPEIAWESAAILEGIARPDMTIQESRDRAIKNFEKIGLPPGKITEFSKKFFDVGQKPENVENIVRKVGHGFEVLVPVEKMEEGITKGKELFKTEFDDQIWEVAGFAVSRMSELLAFKVLHEGSVRGIKAAKGKLQGIKKRKTYTSKEFNDLAERINEIDLSRIKDPKAKAEAENVKNAMNEEITQAAKKIHEIPVDRISKKQAELNKINEALEESIKQRQIEREKFKKSEEKNIEVNQDALSKENIDKKLNELVEKDVVPFDEKIIIDEANKLGVDIEFQGHQEGFGKVPGVELYNITSGNAKGATIGFREGMTIDEINAKIKKTVEDFSKTKTSEIKSEIIEDSKPKAVPKDIKEKIIKEDLKPSEPIVEERSVFQDEMDKIDETLIESKKDEPKVKSTYDDLIIKGEDIPIFKDKYDADFGGYKIKTNASFKTKASAEKRIKTLKGDFEVIKVKDKYRIAEKSSIIEDSIKDELTPERRKLLQELTDENNQTILTDRNYKYMKEPEQLMEEIDIYGETMRKWISEPDADISILLNVERELKKISSDAPLNDPRYETINDYIDNMLTGIDKIKVEKGIGDRAHVLLDENRPLEEKLSVAESPDDVVATTMGEIFDLAEDNFLKGVGKDAEALKELFDFFNDERGSFSTKELSPEKVQQLRKIIERAREEGYEVFKYLITEGYSERDAMIVDEFIKMRADIGLPNFNIKDFKSKARKIDQAKRTAIRMEIDKRIIDNTPKEKLNKFYQYLIETGGIVKGYKKGSYVLPQHMKTGINVKRTPKILSDNFNETLQSPHYQFKKVFDILDNPSIDMQQSNMAFVTNVKNYKNWKEDLFKTFNKNQKVREKRIQEVLGPVYTKHAKDIKKRGSIIRKIGVVKNQIKKSPKDMKEKYKERLIDLKLKSKLLSDKLSQLPKDYDIAISQLYDDPVVKATLHAGGQLPKDIRLNAEELFLSNRLREYFLNKKEHLKDVGIKVEESKPYMTRLWDSVVEASDDVKMYRTILKRFRAPEILDFQRQMPNGRIWIPDANQILDFYIPLVEKKLAHQPFFNRFAETMAGANTPLLNFYNKWIEQNLYRKARNGLAKLSDKSVNGLVDFEYMRLIGLSLSVAYKHLMKLPNTFSTYNIKTNLQSSRLAFKAAGQALKKTFGREPKGNELSIIEAFLKQRSIVAELDQMPGLREGSKRFKALIAQPTVAIEAFENGLSVMSGIISGVNKMSHERVRRAIWENILESNFRGAADQPLWMKGTIARAATMFTMTPIKLLEFKYNLIKGALKGTKDIFGTSYRTRLVRYLMYIGLAESIARANDTSTLEPFLHPPFLSHFIKPTKTGYKFTNPDIYMSPILDLYTGISNKGLFGGTKEHFDYFGTASKISNFWNKKYPTDYYDSWVKQMFGLPSIDTNPKSPRSRKSGGIGEGFSSGFGGL